ncbi:MAG: ribose-5-phosphate isomerase RpiA [Rhizobiales bacterium]|nr:ribose-5-phosphate isomerase RpiA [Hyphomicrobiales bacterium]
MADLEAWKKAAAERSLDYVESGMRIGLGTGSTVEHLLVALGERVRAGLDIVGVPTSERTERRARELSIPLTTLDEDTFLDLTIDGTDEIDGELRLIKGGGGALLREKIVAVASQRMIVIADWSKRVATLGRFPLPVEIVRFACGATRAMVEGLAADADCHGEVVYRRTPTGELYITDQGNLILDCHFKRIPEPEALDDALRMIPGVIEHGLFLGLADNAVIAGPNGIEVLTAPPFDDPA